MKKIAFFTAIAGVLLISGCSSKTPEIESTDLAEPSTQVSTPISVPEPETVNSQEDLQMQIKKLSGEVRTVYFDFDKFNIRPDMQPVISYNADSIANTKADNFGIKLEGNCDEWGSDEYNYALGLKRAKTVKDALVSQGVNANQITIVSYGKSNPVCNERTKSCDAKNRRVNFQFFE